MSNYVCDLLTCIYFVVSAVCNTGQRNHPHVHNKRNGRSLRKPPADHGLQGREKLSKGGARIVILFSDQCAAYAYARTYRRQACTRRGRFARDRKSGAAQAAPAAPFSPGPVAAILRRVRVTLADVGVWIVSCV